MQESCDSQSALLLAADAPPPRQRKVPTIVIVLVLTAVQASFGGNAILIKVAVSEKADPIVFSFFRDVGGAILLMAAAKMSGSLRWPRPEHWGSFVVLGVLGVYIGQMFLTVALKYVEPINASVLQPSQPVLTVGLAALFGIEPLHATTRHGQLKLIGIGYLIGGLAVGLVLPVGDIQADDWAWLVRSPLACGALAYAILMTSGFNYAAQAFANKHSSPITVTAFFPLQLVFTSLFSWLACGKRPTTADYVGAGMIVCGLAAVTMGRVLQARSQGAGDAGA